MSDSPVENQSAILTSEHQELVGRWCVRQYAPEPVEAGSIRRFVQAIMDPDPLYWDPEYARATRFGGIVAPPLYPLHAIHCSHTLTDPLEAASRNRDFDGFGELTTGFGLKSLDLPLRRLLNGGNDHSITSLAKIGDFISAVSCYERLYEKSGKSGPMIFVVIFTRYEAEQVGSDVRRELLTNRQTYIWR